MEKREVSNKENNNQESYGYDFVPTISHWTNIDEQKKMTKYLQNICTRKSTNNSEKKN